LIIVDGEGYTFTPTPLYLEAETTHDSARNALRLSHEQVSEALARLSPAAKAIAIAQTDDKEEKARIANLPVEVGAILVDDIQFQQVDNKLKEAPPVKFDLARQVRVFEPYLQYVELSLTGAAIQRHRISIPPCIQKLGSSEDLEGRLRTTFDLINKDDKLSSKSLDASLRSIRDDLTKSLGKQGRVISKAQKPLLMKRLGELRVKLKAHQDTVADELQQHLDGSRKQIIDYYLPLAIQNPSDAIHGQLLVATEPTENDVRRWLNAQLDSVFPRSETLIQDMRLEERFKDVTYETLNHKEFLQSVKKAFSGTGIDWDKAYEEFLAAGEKDSDAHEE
jgi:hypothetical protein